MLCIGVDCLLALLGCVDTASSTAALAGAPLDLRPRATARSSSPALCAAPPVDAAFDATRGSHSKSTPRYAKTELQALMEYGVTDWLTAIALPSLQHVDIAAPADASRTGPRQQRIRRSRPHRCKARPTGSCRAQATVRVPGTFDTGNPAAIGYTGFDVDLRALFGASFHRLSGMAGVIRRCTTRRSSFRAGGPPSELRGWT